MPYNYTLTYVQFATIKTGHKIRIELIINRRTIDWLLIAYFYALFVHWYQVTYNGMFQNLEYIFKLLNEVKRIINFL